MAKAVSEEEELTSQPLITTRLAAELEQSLVLVDVPSGLLITTLYCQSPFSFCVMHFWPSKVF